MTEKHLNRGDCTIDHLHGHFAHSPTSVTMFAALLTGLPYSFTAHAKDIYTSHREQLREKLHRAAFAVTCTAYNANYLKDVAGSIDTPIYCIYHGIDTSLFHSQGARITCSQPYRLLTVARIAEKKGLPTLYHALAKLKANGINFHHTLIGDGDDREKILNLIEELGLARHCEWLGTRTHNEVLQQFRKSDLFILGCQIAANGDRDGIPNVLVESLAMGVPVVTTDVSAIPELIVNDVTGKLVPPGDSDAMADAVLAILADSKLRHTIIKAGKRQVRDNFDNIRLTAQLGEIFIEHASN